MPPFLTDNFVLQSPGGWLSRRLRSFVYAVRGLHYVLRHEANARIHLAAALGTAAAGLLLRISAADWRWLILGVGLVWAAEALNTAIERLCDVVSPGPDETVRIVKDVAAGAVLVCALTAAAIGAATLLPYLEPYR